jgi:hypothetical protein
MRTIKFTSWQDGEFHIGYLNDYPDYQTQGTTKEELVENLKDLLLDFESGQVPFVHKIEELLVA